MNLQPKHVPLMGGASRWKIFIKDLKISCRLGIYPHEMDSPQDVVINLSCDYIAPCPDGFSADQVVCYEKLSTHIMHLGMREHTPFVEQLAEKIVHFCLEDARICRAHVRIEKINAVEKAQSVGCEFTLKRDWEKP